MYSCELCGNDAHYGYDCLPQVPLVYELELGYNQNFDDNFPQTSPNDDDEESSIPLRDLISELPLSVAITPDLPITDSLIIEDEHLDTIPETESDEENESSVKDFNLTPKSDLIESLLNRDTSIGSSPKFDSLLEEFSGELAHINLISLEIDEADFDPEEEIRLVEKLLYDNSSPRPPKKLNSENSDVVIESFSPSPIPVEDRDILFLEELLNNDSLSLPKNESFHFDHYYDPSSPHPPAKLPDDDGIHFDFEPDTGILTAKVVDDISEHYVLMPSILPTHPTRCLVINTLLPFLSENENKVFNSSILAYNEEKSPQPDDDLLSHRGFKDFHVISGFSESPMMIYEEDIPLLDVPFLYFYPP
ncbi:hypothetical protein Tco_1427826 [Tanacetum coccineum]